MRYLLAVLLLASTCLAEPCVIVARHASKFGENMSRLHPHRPFDFVAGEYPNGFKWRSELSDSDIRELVKKGGRFAVIQPNYTPAQLEQAEKECQAPPEKVAAK